jgi:hypothetical protein
MKEEREDYYDPEEDFYDDEEDEICGYYCLNCGQDFDTPAPFHECPWCCCGSIDPIYF